jgi:SHS2 domain-containing protein
MRIIFMPVAVGRNALPAVAGQAHYRGFSPNSEASQLTAPACTREIHIGQAERDGDCFGCPRPGTESGVVMEAHFELFDHTADVGVRVLADSLPALIRPASEGLYAVIGELRATGSGERVQLDYADEEPAILLRDYLAELLLRFDRDRQIMTTIDVQEFRPGRLSVDVRMQAVDAVASVFYHEVKAVTYHELGIRALPEGYEARYIVDV